jgi:hypothetical protein
MRRAGVLVLLCLFGCRNTGNVDAAPDPAAEKAQQELLARRDALVAARQKLQTERESVVKEILAGEAQGSDVTDLKKKKAELDTQIESSTSDLISMVNSKLDAIKQSGDKREGLAQREAEVANRERTLAERERALADREKALVQRDFELSQRWKDSCTIASVAPLPPPPPKGGNYTKADVGALIAKAKAGMTKKSLLPSDLPGPAQGLESEASKAMNDNDISQAYFKAAQLAAVVDSVVVNRPFIQTKIAKLQAQIKGSKVDEPSQQQLAQGLVDVMQKYNDGDFVAANRRLNQLAAVLNH